MEPVAQQPEAPRPTLQDFMAASEASGPGVAMPDGSVIYPDGSCRRPSGPRWLCSSSPPDYGERIKLVRQYWEELARQAELEYRAMMGANLPRQNAAWIAFYGATTATKLVEVYQHARAVIDLLGGPRKPDRYMGGTQVSGYSMQY
jgi:hypothetical protein